ncbi:MAG TPA: TetR family transcriptional regulator [Chitinophagaceae bacterium]|nr:TetR family transcriptional regulator [Chitinophagaceae bacterium]
MSDMATYNEKQLQILQTAEHLFATKGFEGTSVRDIADEAGVNIAMISYYFRSKEKLMETLFEQRLGNVRMRVESLIKDNSISPVEKVNILIDEHIDRVMQRQKFYKILYCEQVLNRNNMIIDMMNDFKKRHVAIISELIKDGQKKGVFKKKAIDVMLMVNTMVGTVAQMMVGIDYYRNINNLQDMPDEEFETLVKRKLGIHIKTLFKAILTYEA